MGMYAITRTDGSVAIIQTVGDATVNDCIRKWPLSEQGRVVGHRPVALSDIPADRSFRNAWTWTGDRIEHDMVKARAIKREQFRRERAPLLAALDMAYIRADEAKDDVAKAAIAEQKQMLRNVPADPAIDAATTPDELKALSLSDLAASAVNAAMAADRLP